MKSTTNLTLCTTKKEIRDFAKDLKLSNKIIGLVPTMGALHKGHISLIEESLKATEATVVTIFVNPMQFNPNEDLDKYPRTLDSDLEICSKLGVKAVFAPDNKEMYPNDIIFKVVPPEFYSNKLCGVSRPGHFEGVATVVTKLFNIIPADKAFFGLKDAQQLFIIKKMVEFLNIPIEIVACQTQREPDGLAFSSRNLSLDSQSRQIAPMLYKSLCFIKSQYLTGETDFNLLSQHVQKEMLGYFNEINLDYLMAYNYDNLNLVTKLTNNTLIAIAAKIGNVRLIDNIILD